MSPIQQNSLVFFVNFIVIFTVLGLLGLGYSSFHHVSIAFWIVEGFACAIPLVAGSADNWMVAARGGGDESDEPALVKWWTDRREAQMPFFSLGGFVSLRGVIYLSTGLSFAAMWILVDDTGGGIQSPFAPLLVAPAILGPFIVRGKETLALLLAIAFAVVFGEDLTASKAAGLGHPDNWVYPTVTLLLVCSAIIISYVRMETEGPAWALPRRWIAEARARLKRRKQPPLETPAPDTITPGDAES